MPSAAWRARRPRSRRCGTRGATPQEAVAAHRAEVERAQREADWLRHAGRRIAQARAAGRRGDRARRAPRRHDAGRKGRRGSARGARRASPAPSRRCPRLPPRSAGSSGARAGARPGRAGGEGARRRARLRWRRRARHLEAAMRTADYDPAELERIEERLFALRAAGRKYNVPVDELAALARKYNADLALIDAGAERAESAGSGRARPSAPTAGRGAGAVAGARARPPARSTRRSTANCKPLKLERAQILDARSTATPAPPARTASTASSSGCRPIPARGRAR